MRKYTRLAREKNDLFSCPLWKPRLRNLFLVNTIRVILIDRLPRIIRARPLLACAAIFAATATAYLPAIRGGFIWDDDAHVTKPALQSLDGLRRIWFELGATQQYYPVLHSAFWVEHRLWGDAPAAYHLPNVILHATAACLVAFAVQRVWSGSRAAAPSGAAWLAAFIFALHPVCVESVAWISETKNTLSTVFYLLAGLAYLRWKEARAERVARPALYLLATGLFALAVLTKSVTATLPAALLVVFWWRRGRLLWLEDVAPLLPWFGLGATAGAFTAWVERTVLGAEGPGFALGFPDRCLLAGRVFWFYFGKLLWPANLVFIYPHWRVDGGAWWQYLYPAAAAILVFVLWKIARRGPRGPLAAVLFFLGSLFPALGFFNVYPFIFSYVADHFQYLASLGIITLGAAAWDLWRTRAEQARGAASGAAAAAVVALGILTNFQCRNYRDAETLYRATLAKNPGCWMAAYNLGVTLDGVGRTHEAIACYERALQLKPDFPQAHNNLGVALAGAGRLPEAVAHYEAATASYRRNARLARDQADAEYNLGRALQEMGRTTEAAAQYESALRLRPDLTGAANSLGRMLADAGRASDAIPPYERALRLNPDNPDLLNDYGAALAMVGRTSEAIPRFEEALRIRPDFPDAVFNLAGAFRQAGRIPEAIAGCKEALRLNPDFADACGRLGVLLAESGRPSEAIGYYERALRLKPANAEIHYDLGVALREMGRLSEAIAHYEAALGLRPDFPDAENDLGIALAQSGRLDEAVAHFAAALRLKPDYADAHNNLGLVLRSLGRTREAEAQFEEAARPGAPAAH